MITRARFWVNAVAATTIMLALSSLSRAEVFRWNSLVGGNFEDPSLWSPFHPFGPRGPGNADDTVIFDLPLAPADYLVSSVSGLNSRLIVGNNTLTLEFFDFLARPTAYSTASGTFSAPSLTVGVDNGDFANLTLHGVTGSRLTTRHSSIGHAAGSTAVVTVEKLQWTGERELLVGTAGTGGLLIRDGAVTQPGTIVGYAPGSSGYVTVRGGRSSLSSSTLIVGTFGSGELNVEAGGTVMSDSGFLGVPGYGEANVSGFGSSWQVDRNLYVGGNTTAPQGVGILNVSSNALVDVGGTLKLWNEGVINLDDATLSATTVDIQPMGRFTGSGGLLANVRNAGIVVPNSASDGLAIKGSYTQTGEGTLRIHLLPPAAFEGLSVTGTASLSGNLEFFLPDSFTPTPGQSFTILTGSIIGNFNRYSHPLLPGLDFELDYHPDSVVLRIVAQGVPGDYNSDGVVDSADYVMWRKTLGQSGPRLAADGNRSGSVDAPDYDIWKENFGRYAAREEHLLRDGVAMAVPEPASLGLITFVAWLARPLGRCRAPARNDR